MFVPFISKRSSWRKGLFRRKGGGGKGGGGSTARSSPISTGGKSQSATPHGFGGGPVSSIPAGQPFAGRSIGGGTRDQVYGTKQFGSGYPGASTAGVAGQGFPFVFWPVTFGGAGYYYYHNRNDTDPNEYGRYDNATRPGGVQMTAAFPSLVQNDTTFRILADNFTVVSLVEDIRLSCSSLIRDVSSISATPYSDTLPAPKPEQAIQYYRASSVSLTLDSYNNTGVFGPPETPDTPLPTAIDVSLMNCLNSTIGAAVPLVGGSTSTNLPFIYGNRIGLSVLAALIWALSNAI
jgi:hypothetical protein